MLGDREGARLTRAFERALRKAKAKKEIGKTLDERVAAQFRLATLSGLKVAAKAGVNNKNLKGIALFAIRSLKAARYLQN